MKGTKKILKNFCEGTHVQAERNSAKSYVSVGNNGIAAFAGRTKDSVELTNATRTCFKQATDSSESNSTCLVFARSQLGYYPVSTEAEFLRHVETGKFYRLLTKKDNEIGNALGWSSLNDLQF
jgi:hypothetical protein